MYKNQRFKKVSDIWAKIIAVGNPGAGKSTILNSLVGP